MAKVTIDPHEVLLADLSPQRRSVIFPVLELIVITGLIWLGVGLIDAHFDAVAQATFGVHYSPSSVVVAQLPHDQTLMVLLWLEQRAQRRLRFVGSATARASSSEARPIPLRGMRGAIAWVLCLLPVLMGFVLPVGFMLRPLSADWSVLPWDRFLI